MSKFSDKTLRPRSLPTSRPFDQNIKHISGSFDAASGGSSDNAPWHCHPSQVKYFLQENNSNSPSLSVQAAGQEVQQALHVVQELRVPGQEDRRVLQGLLPLRVRRVQHLVLELLSLKVWGEQHDIRKIILQIEGWVYNCCKRNLLL